VPPAADIPAVDLSGLPDAALRTECRVLLDLLYHEIGRKWMSLELRLHLEELEELLRSTP
jgi:hypothetical protein